MELRQIRPRQTAVLTDLGGLAIVSQHSGHNKEKSWRMVTRATVTGAQCGGHEDTRTGTRVPSNAAAASSYTVTGWRSLASAAAASSSCNADTVTDWRLVACTCHWSSDLLQCKWGLLNFNSYTTFFLHNTIHRAAWPVSWCRPSPPPPHYWCSLQPLLITPFRSVFALELDTKDIQRFTKIWDWLA